GGGERGEGGDGRGWIAKATGAAEIGGRVMATEIAVETQQNFVGGRWVPAASGKTFENRNPADRDDLVGLFPKSGKADVDAAVAAAKKAFPGWRNTPAPRRAEALYAAGEILKRDKERRRARHARKRVE